MGDRISFNHDAGGDKKMIEPLDGRKLSHEKRKLKTYSYLCSIER